MPKNATKFSTNAASMVQLVEDNEVIARLGEAKAAILMNPTVVWAKFVLTDDKKNANGQRIPREEFANLIRSGINMPVKMAIGEVNPGHEGSQPLGVMTHLARETLENGADAIVALAALWERERPADVKYIKQRFSEGQDVDISWEILYEDSIFNEENASMDLLGTVLSAATIVGIPAYQGRTQFLAVAAKKWSKAYIAELPDSSFLYIDNNGERFLPIADKDGTLDRVKVVEAMEQLGELNIPGTVLKEKKAILQNLQNRFEAGASVKELSLEFASDRSNNLEEELNEIEKLKADLLEVQAKLDEALASAATKDSAIAEKDADIARLTEEKNNLETELAPLKEFKALADAEAARTQKLEEVKTKFTEASLEVTEEYISENSEALLKAHESGTLEFLIQEMASFAKKSGDAKSASASVKLIPVITNEETDNGSTPSISELAAELRNRKTKK